LLVEAMLGQMRHQGRCVSLVILVAMERMSRTT
jgi:hypothetical protein